MYFQGLFYGKELFFYHWWNPWIFGEVAAPSRWLPLRSFDSDGSLAVVKWSRDGAVRCCKSVSHAQFEHKRTCKSAREKLGISEYHVCCLICCASDYGGRDVVAMSNCFFWLRKSCEQDSTVARSILPKLGPCSSNTSLGGCFYGLQPATQSAGEFTRRGLPDDAFDRSTKKRGLNYVLNFLIDTWQKHIYSYICTHTISYILICTGMVWIFDISH